MIYLAVIIMVIIKILPAICLLILFTILIVQKNINGFIKKQDKDTTFLLAVNNYIIIMGTITLLIFIGGLIR